MNIETIIKDYGHKITTLDLQMNIDGWIYHVDFIDKNMNPARAVSHYPMSLDRMLQNIHMTLWQNCN